MVMEDARVRQGAFIVYQESGMGLLYVYQPVDGPLINDRRRCWAEKIEASTSVGRRFRQAA